MGSDSGKDSGQEKSGPSFFDNLAEDLGNVLSGNVTSPHSAYDVRNADAMAKNNHDQKEDYLPGGKYGPGSGSYSPSEFHNAGIEKQDGLGSKSPDNAQNATDVSGPSRAVQSLLKEDALTGLSTPSLSPTIDDSVGPLGLNKTKDVSKVQAALVDEGDLDEQTGYIGTKTLDATKAFQDKKGLKVDGQINPGGPTERALLGARSEIASPYSRAPAGTPSIEQQTKTWAESQHRQQQAKQAPPSGYFSKNGVTFTDNWANDLIGVTAAATATPKDGLLERTQDQKAADVGEQPQNAPTTYEQIAQAIEEQRQNLLHTHQASVSGVPESILNGVYDNLTSWHFEKRDLLNSPLPKNEQEAINMGFQKYSSDQSIYHQNGAGKPEKKYGHVDGREVVFDGDTGMVVADDRYKGTFNYVSPSAVPENYDDLSAWGNYAVNGLGHIVTDVGPYWAGGNVRGRN